MSIDPFGFNFYYRDFSARLSEDITIWQFATVEADVTTGKRCVIGSNVWVGRGSTLGDDVRIQHGAFIARGSTIGNRVFIGPCAVLTDDKYPQVNHPTYRAEPPVLEDDCAIGAGAVLLPGVRIGKGATVGAGAVVTANVPAGATVMGIPARVVVTHNSQGVCHEEHVT